jgi:hypothetical protein
MECKENYPSWRSTCSMYALTAVGNAMAQMACNGVWAYGGCKAAEHNAAPVLVVVPPV